MIAEQKNSISLASVVMNAGVDLQQRSNRHVGLCPFHGDTEPSFYVFPDQRFKCFGCGERGDVIDFVRKLHGLTFPDALKYLGIEQGRITSSVRRDIERRKRRVVLLQQFRDFEEKYCSYISKLYRRTKKLMLNGIPEGDLELYAPLLHALPVLGYHRDILIYGNDKLKFKLYEDKGTRNAGRKI